MVDIFENKMNLKLKMVWPQLLKWRDVYLNTKDIPDIFSGVWGGYISIYKYISVHNEP